MICIYIYIYMTTKCLIVARSVFVAAPYFTQHVQECLSSTVKPTVNSQLQYFIAFSPLHRQIKKFHNRHTVILYFRLTLLQEKPHI